MANTMDYSNTRAMQAHLSLLGWYPINLTRIDASCVKLPGCSGMANNEDSLIIQGKNVLMTRSVGSREHYRIEWTELSKFEWSLLLRKWRDFYEVAEDFTTLVPVYS